jgi:hypothetical protein
VSIPLTVLPLAGGKIKIEGNTSVGMSDFGIEAPQFGASGTTIRVGNAVKLNFEWGLGPATNPVGPTPHYVRPLYILEAGGAVIGLTNAANSTPVRLSFLQWGSGSDYLNFGDVAFFRVTNEDTRSILVWNVRVQVLTTNTATDSSKWRNVVDDYPPGPGNAKIQSGSSEEFRVQRVFETPWRVCILYSKDWTGTATSFNGNYEIISEEIKE